VLRASKPCQANADHLAFLGQTRHRLLKELLLVFAEFAAFSDNAPKARLNAASTLSA
jgi:hypothetical protein